MAKIRRAARITHFFLFSTIHASSRSDIDGHRGTHADNTDLMQLHHRAALNASSRAGDTVEDQVKCHILFFLRDHDLRGRHMKAQVEQLFANLELEHNDKYFPFLCLDNYVTKGFLNVRDIAPAYGEHVVDYENGVKVVETYTHNGRQIRQISDTYKDGNSMAHPGAVRWCIQTSMTKCMRQAGPDFGEDATAPKPGLIISFHGQSVDDNNSVGAWNRNVNIKLALREALLMQIPSVDKFTLIAFNGIVDSTVEALQLYGAETEYFMSFESHNSGFLDLKQFSSKGDVMAVARSLIDNSVGAFPEYTPKAMAYFRTSHVYKFSTMWRMLGNILLVHVEKNQAFASVLFWARTASIEIPNTVPPSVDVKTLLRNLRTACNVVLSRPRSQQCSARAMKTIDSSLEIFRSVLARSYFRKNRNRLSEPLSGLAVLFPTQFIADRNQNYMDIFRWLMGDPFSLASTYGWYGVVHRLLCGKPLAETVSERATGATVGNGLDATLHDHSALSDLRFGSSFKDPNEDKGDMH